MYVVVWVLVLNNEILLGLSLFVFILDFIVWEKKWSVYGKSFIECFKFFVNVLNRNNFRRVNIFF